MLTGIIRSDSMNQVLHLLTSIIREVFFAETNRYYMLNDKYNKKCLYKIYIIKK